MAIKLENLTIKNIFTDVNIEMPQNKIITIVGRSGTGKTLLLKTLNKEMFDYAGIIKINNKTIIKRKDNIDLSNIFYISQDYEKYFNSLKIIDDIKRISGNKTNKLYTLLDEYKLDTSVLKKSFYELSSGELKKIIIICMLLNDPKIVLIDEPTLGLDAKSTQTFIKWLKKAKRNKTIIISSNDSEFILKVADIIYAITNNNIVEYYNKYEFFETNIKEYGLQMPKLLEFIKLANNKNIKLMYRDETNDVLKDVYRNEK